MSEYAKGRSPTSPKSCVNEALPWPTRVNQPSARTSESEISLTATCRCSPHEGVWSSRACPHSCPLPRDRPRETVFEVHGCPESQQSLGFSDVWDAQLHVREVPRHE